MPVTQLTADAFGLAEDLLDAIAYERDLAQAERGAALKKMEEHAAAGRQEEAARCSTLAEQWGAALSGISKALSRCQRIVDNAELECERAAEEERR